MNTRTRMLIIDDNVYLCDSLRDTFEDQDYHVSTAYTGADGLAMLRKGMYHITLLDMRLPDVQGIELLPTIHEMWPDMPVIIITAFASLETAVQALQLGAYGYIVKPLNVGEMSVTIERALEKLRLVVHDRRLAEQLRALNQIGQDLGSILDVQEVGEQLLQSATEIIGAEGASVWLWDSEQEGWLTCRAISYGQGDSLRDLRLRPGQGVAGWAAQTEQSIIITNASDDPHFFPGIDGQTDFHTRSMLVAPLRARGRVMGVLEVVNKLDGEFDAGDLALAETLAASAAIAVDNAQLVEALRRYTVELEASNEDLDAFAHTVAHDLKGTLGYIVGFAQVLEMDYATLSKDEAGDCLRAVVQSGRKMSNIIDELLLLASVRKLEDVQAELVDMANVVAGAQGRLADLIARHEADIIVPDNWPVALGYGPWVEEVWVNYLSNALKYGGRPPRVELGADQLPNQPSIRFWVRDNGSGLTPKEQGRLFTLFTRLGQVHAKGHGLGLSIVHRIVEKLGGEVGVESQVGQGSVFWFTLPSEGALQSPEEENDG